MSTKGNASNGAGTLERRGALWWLQILRPLEPGKTKRRRGRIPIEGSEKMTEAQARRASVAIARDFRAGKIVFGDKPRKGALPSPVMTVLGEAWTSGALYEKHGGVNWLRVKTTADIDTWTMAKHVYPIKTRGPAGPDFGDLQVSDVTSDDIAAVMGAHGKELAAQTRMHTNVEPLRFHDLRSTFCTWARRAGKSDAWRHDLAVRPRGDHAGQSLLRALPGHLERSS